MNIKAKQSLKGQASNSSALSDKISIGRPLATIEVEEIEGGHKIKVSDLSGEHELEIINGTDGYTPKKGEDYFTEEEKLEIKQNILEEISAFSLARISTIVLPADKWEGTGSLYSQLVDIEGVTENSQVDLTPSVEQLVVFYEKDITFVTENEGGVVTVFAIGQKPQNDYTIQVTITEVEHE